MLDLRVSKGSNQLWWLHWQAFLKLCLSLKLHILNVVYGMGLGRLYENFLDRSMHVIKFSKGFRTARFFLDCIISCSNILIMFHDVYVPFALTLIWIFIVGGGYTGRCPSTVWLFSTCLKEPIPASLISFKNMKSWVDLYVTTVLSTGTLILQHLHMKDAFSVRLKMLSSLHPGTKLNI